MNRSRLGAAWGLTLLIGASPAQAGTFLAMDLPQLVAESEAIVLGEIVDVKSSWTPDNRVIVTDAIVRVSEHLIGNAADELTVRTFGGEVDGYQVVAHGFPSFEEGEQAVLFLQRNPADETLRVTGYQLGHYRVVVRDDHLVAAPTLDQGAHLLTPDGEHAVRPRSHRLSTFAQTLRESASLLDETKP